MSLNKLVNEMMGKPMTKKEKSFGNKLRKQYNAGEITLGQAHRIWDKKVLNIDRPKKYYEMFDRIKKH